MKKRIAILILFLHLFNIGGQLALHQYLAYKTDKFFTEQIRKGLYNVEDLTEVAIPVNLPGISDWSRFENISGQIQFENTNYNYVKMRLTRNAMYLMCIPNYATTHLSSENILKAKGIQGIPVPQKDHVPYGKSILQDNLNFCFVKFDFYCPVKNLPQSIEQPVQQLIYQQKDIPEQPPKMDAARFLI
ncbi:hypothetical protein [Mucilaginibacter lappiensis]|uniref:Uncharacterized protein n=1 Tax=Mucilaginibacter lappiensis TaxID=354630 RepID=A0A841JJB4_9SPHI|nr:hypothetical protein [Mucilaginibacter lappiensis]MBB6111644.1 hypothetical protein [Mucilaginibacter lappiensis]MBB6131050.1 hypothetical protein [Mucilaginibacter lappiensis]